MTTEGTSLTKAEAKDLATLYDQQGIEDRAGEMQANATQDDYAMPFLALLQSGSPQCKKSDPRFIKGAAEGMYMNTVDHELFDGEKGVIVIPCAYRRAFVEWKTRESGGGYVREHPIEHGIKTFVDDKNRDIIEENGNELKDTRYWYVLILREDGTAEPAVIGMTRTQVKPSRLWFNLCAKNKWPDGKERAKAPPSYVWTYRLGVMPQQKDDNSYWIPTIDRAVPVTNGAVLSLAMQLHDSVKSGAVREATDSLTEEAGEEATAGKDSF